MPLHRMTGKRLESLDGPYDAGTVRAPLDSELRRETRRWAACVQSLNSPLSLPLATSPFVSLGGDSPLGLLRQHDALPPRLHRV